MNEDAMTDGLSPRMQELRKRYREMKEHRVNGKEIEMIPPRYDQIYYDAIARMDEEDAYIPGENVTDMFNVARDVGVVVSVRFTREEFALLDDASHRDSKTISDFIRERVFQDRTDIQIKG